jgi:hypothetical protein
MLTHRSLWFSAVGVAIVAALACASLLLAFAPSGATGVQPPTAQKVPALSLQEILLPSANSGSVVAPMPTTTTPVATPSPAVTTPLPPTVTTTTTIAAGIPTSQRVQQTSVLCAVGSTISPAPASDTPATSQQELISTLESSGRGLGEPDRAGNLVQPTILYGLVTDSEYGHMNADGSVTPFFVNYPAWIVEYQGIGLPASGGPASLPNSSSTTTTSTQPARAPTTWWFYDAQSGSYRFALSC